MINPIPAYGEFRPESSIPVNHKFVAWLWEVHRGYISTRLQPDRTRQPPRRKHAEAPNKARCGCEPGRSDQRSDIGSKCGGEDEHECRGAVGIEDSEQVSAPKLYGVKAEVRAETSR